MAKVRSKVITCNHCGTTNAAGAKHCQSCGFLLTNTGNNSMYSSMENSGGSAGSGVSQDQPALPAWLESLRSGMGDAADASFTSENQSDSYFDDRNHSNQPYTSGQWGNTTNRDGSQQNQPA